MEREYVCHYTECCFIGERKSRRFNIIMSGGGGAQRDSSQLLDEVDEAGIGITIRVKVRVMVRVKNRVRGNIRVMVRIRPSHE